jgi:hypothetical protein
MFKFLATSALAVLFWGAQAASANTVLIDGVDCETYPLYAGQYMEAGTVTVCQNGHVTFEANEGWLLSETHLEVASSLEQIPQMNGNPIPGQFTYKGEFDPAVSSYTYELDPFISTTYIAAHAVALQLQEACIDFEEYTEKHPVGDVDTANGLVSFLMVERAPLVPLSVGDTATFQPGVFPNDLPVVATPDTSPPQDNIVAFTVGSSLRDDYVADPNSTNAGGNTLTDPQDTTQVPLQQHAIAQGLAIAADISDIPNLLSVSLVGVDLDWGETWVFQFFDQYNQLVEQVTLTCDLAPCPGDGKAFPITSTVSGVEKIAVWGGGNNNVTDRIGYAIDYVCTTAVVGDETAWGDGDVDFPGANWATYIVYSPMMTP